MKKFFPLLIIILLLVFVRNISVSILATINEEGAREKLEKQIAEEEKKQVYLKERLYYVETDEFIEEEAKEKLGMLRDGEFFVIAPTESPTREAPIEIDTRGNWQKWLDLFF